MEEAGPGSPLLAAALRAADRGWSVFPLVPGGKTPAIRGWEGRATRDRQQILRWWSRHPDCNIAVATGRSGLVVVDLDDAGTGTPPERFAGARHGGDVLAMLAAEAAAEVSRTYTVATPRGRHLYFAAPAGSKLRNTAGSIGWRIDTRANGGYVVAAGSMRAEGRYVVADAVPPVELPGWLTSSFSPVPRRVPAHSQQLPVDRAQAYIRAIVEREVRIVATAPTGTRHTTLLKAARTLGRLVGGGELAEEDARSTLLDSAAGHIGVDGCTAGEVYRTVGDGLRYGKQLPRYITGHARPIAFAARPAPRRARTTSSTTGRRC